MLETSETIFKIQELTKIQMVKSTYTFYGALEWAKHVLRDLQKATRGVPEDKLKAVEIARIKKMYSNTL